MRNVLGPDTILGYCTNVHAGADLTQMRANLEHHALAVKQRISPDQPMGVGLWFSAQAARQLVEQQRTLELRDWLHDHGLLPYTLNGFPHGNFHEPVVKHRVYEPDWTTQARFDYTVDLITILADLLPDEAEGSISTLPVGWPGPDRSADADRCAAAADRLFDLVHHLARTELDTGKLIHVDLEPEPGCLLDTAGDVVRFFENHLLGTPDELSVRSYLRVCHDVCHSAVMLERQADALDTYRRGGISVGKVQVSSAIGADLADADTVHALARFDEPRYLHQTMIRSGDTQRLVNDLPQVLDELRQSRDGEAIVHFHVPIHLGRIGRLRTTQADILECLRAIREDDEIHHFEVETYAWNVLPDDLRPGELSEGIARELDWLSRQAAGEPTR